MIIIIIIIIVYVRIVPVQLKSLFSAKVIKSIGGGEGGRDINARINFLIS